MSSLVLFLEGKFLGYTGAVLSGLNGGLPGGLTGGYQRKKAQAAQQELDRREGKLDLFKSNAAGSATWHTVGGFLPGVGIVTNLVAASKRYGLEDRLKAQGDKPGKA